MILAPVKATWRDTGPPTQVPQMQSWNTTQQCQAIGEFSRGHNSERLKALKQTTICFLWGELNAVKKMWRNYLWLPAMAGLQLEKLPEPQVHREQKPKGVDERGSK